MRLVVLSDLHLDTRGNMESFLKGLSKFKKDHGDDFLLVVAGDVCQLGGPTFDLLTAKTLHTGLASEFRGGMVFVPGNHEYWDTSISTVDEMLREWENEIPNWHLLDPGNYIYIDNTRFLGGALWYDGLHERHLEPMMPDFSYIKDIDQAYQHNRQFVDNICNLMCPGDVVVSHHLPSPKSTPWQFKKSPINAFFVSDQSYWIEQKQPQLWLHGHSHSPSDYKIGETRIYCNPMGYNKEGTNGNFWDRCIIEVD